jgi:predicted ribosome quality control (RQC) complex YloA/Tae2 family protein
LLATAGIAQSACTRWIRRLENALARIPDAGLELAQIADLEQKAQAVLHGRRHPAGTKSLDLDLWLESGPQKIRVELDPSRAPHEQAQDWIATARRRRRGLEHMATRRGATEAELHEARQWLEQCSAWQNPESIPDKREIRQRQSQLDSLAAKLLPRGLWPQPPRRREEERPTGPIRWNLPGGWILLAGRSGTENDLLTQRVALAHDLWFHAAHVPGSHVILRSPDGKPATAPTELVELAAGVAAWLSKLRAQGVAEVHFTEKRHVRKPRKAPPGSVVLDHSRTLRVKPVPPPREAT